MAKHSEFLIFNMKILVLSIGTRGDVEPMVAIAEILSRYGHDVSCAFSEEFRYLVDGTPLSFISLGSEYMNVLETDNAKKAIGGSQTGVRKLISQLKFVKMHLEIEEDTVLNQYRAVEESDPDLLVHNGISFYPFVWMLDHPGQTVLISAVPYGMHYVRDHPYILLLNIESSTIFYTRNLLCYCAGNTFPSLCRASSRR